MNEKNRFVMFVSQLRLMFTMVYILSYCYAAGSGQIVMAENATSNSKCSAVSLLQSRDSKEKSKKSLA